MQYVITTDEYIFNIKSIGWINEYTEFFEFEIDRVKTAIDGDIIKNLKVGDLFLDLPILKIERRY